MIKITIKDTRPLKDTKKKFRRTIKISLSDLKKRRGRSKFIKNKAIPFLYNTLRTLRDK